MNYVALVFGSLVLATVFTSTLLVVDCTPAPSPAPLPAPDVLEAAPPPGPTPAPPPTTSPCEGAYYHLSRELTCEPSAPPNATWVDVCSTARQHGAEFGLRCIQAARSCAEAQHCLTGK
jgi:hypothetical protein